MGAGSGSKRWSLGCPASSPRWSRVTEGTVVTRAGSRSWTARACASRPALLPNGPRAAAGVWPRRSSTSAPPAMIPITSCSGCWEPSACPTAVSWWPTPVPASFASSPRTVRSCAGSAARARDRANSRASRILTVPRRFADRLGPGPRPAQRFLGRRRARPRLRTRTQGAQSARASAARREASSSRTDRSGAR